MYFPDETRKINLGGASQSLSRSTVLSAARSQRSERSRTAAALKVQELCRSRLETLRVRRELKAVFERDVCGIQGLRALVILGRTDGDVVRVWSEIMASDDDGYVQLVAIWRTDSEQESWVVLIRQVAWLLLLVVLKDPLRAISQRRILNDLLSPSTAGAEMSAKVSLYLVERDFYGLLARSISSIALNAQARESPVLPYLINLAVLPLSTTSSLAALLPIFLNLLTIPLLPNRLPVPSLTLLSSKIPFSHLGQALSPDRVVEETTLVQKLHLIANLQVFVVPRYTLLTSGSLAVYVSLIDKLLNAVPRDTLNPAVVEVEHIRRSSGVPIDSDAEADMYAPSARVVSRTPGSPRVSWPTRAREREQIQLDSRTRKRIAALASAEHVSSLLRLPLSPNQLIGFLTTLCAVWPGVKDVVVEAVVRPPRRLASPIPFVLRVEVFRWWLVRLCEPPLSAAPLVPYRMFSPQEMQIIVGGLNTLVDLEDLRRCTSYPGSYSDEEETVGRFWNAANTFDQQQRKALLTFVTSCDQTPVLGFRELNPSRKQQPTEAAEAAPRNLSLQNHKRNENETTDLRLIQRVQAILENKQEYRKLLAHRDVHAQRLLDMFQSILDTFTDVPPSLRRNLIVAMQRLSAASGLYPASYELLNITTPELAECAGAFADIYKGDCCGRPVCVKSIRLHKGTQMKHFMKVIAREAILWGQLRHPNVVPFYGICRHKGRLSLIAPWMENGDIEDHLERHTTSNRVVLAYDVARGLEFLHQNGIIHGDLKGKNVLVNDFGRACVADFGLSSISDKEILAWTSFSSAKSKGGTARYQAPELFDLESGEPNRNTMASDVYAWACVAYEIFAGEVPFAHLTRDLAIMKSVSTGAKPARPPASSTSWGVWGLTEDIWSLMQTCWDLRPDARPSVEAVASFLVLYLPPGVQKDA
ncbi:hypothetical protein H0H92_000506, partial [Tricholoma furcatifolium]